MIKNKKTEKRTLLSPELEKAGKTASFYGFAHLPHFTVEKNDLLAAKRFGESHLKELHPFAAKKERFGGFLEEKLALLRNFCEKKFIHLGSPVMGFYAAPLDGNPHMKKTIDEETFNLEILGANKSINDAIIIEASFVILRERYPEYELSISINSVGDKDSFARFQRDMTTYISKIHATLGKECAAIVKKDPLALMCCNDEQCKLAQEGAPRPMSYLSEASRIHFKEVLEYLESLGINYNLDHTLAGSKSYCAETIFVIEGKKKGAKDEDSVTLCLGERYNHLAKRALGKKDIPAIGAALLIHPHFVKQKVVQHRELKPKFFYIQIGFDAKLKSLGLIETLRKAGIFVVQSLSKDKLSAQLAQAEKMSIPYVIIMGQREASEDMVVVRNLERMSQNTIAISELVDYLKKIK